MRAEAVVVLGPGATRLPVRICAGLLARYLSGIAGTLNCGGRLMIRDIYPRHYGEPYPDMREPQIEARPRFDRGTVAIGHCFGD